MTETERKRLLVVEDEEDLSLVLSCRLKSAGYQVESVSNGNNALSSASERQPDLVILDVDLPDMTGFDVCQTLRDRQIAAPILMYTGLDQPSEELRGFESGANAYLTKKQCKPEDLLSAIEELLHHS